MMTNKKILNTRPKAWNPKSLETLKDNGIEVIHLPLITVKEYAFYLEQFSPEKFTGIFFSSANGVTHFFNHISPSEFEIWSQKKIFTLSPSAKKELKKNNLNLSFQSKKKSLHGFFHEFKPENKEVWLHPCSTLTKLNPDNYENEKLYITNLPVYHTTANENIQEKLISKLINLQGVVFFSGSGVNSFNQLLNQVSSKQIKSIYQSLQFITVGNTAFETLQEHKPTHCIRTSFDDDWEEMVLNHFK